MKGWALPEHARAEVNAAGRLILERPTAQTIFEYGRALDIVNNWRSAHAFPLNTFQMNLRSRANRFTASSNDATRIKRLPAIRAKLRRMPALDLSEMQDIGGCRAVLSNVADTRALVGLDETKKLKHRLLRVNDYIDDPKSDGYRSIHLIHSYHGDRNDVYNGRYVEMQLRSHLQHIWATTVETVDAFSDQGLKTGGGDAPWKRFFVLMAEVIARLEDCPSVPNTPTSNTSIVKELRHYAKRLDVDNRLKTYRTVANTMQRTGVTYPGYFLLEFDRDQETLRATGYGGTPAEAQEASQDYFKIEEENVSATNPARDVLLANVESVQALRLAYPNYFSDTSEFAQLLAKAIS
jgi:Region found in RelA / SpoT proteins